MQAKGLLPRKLLFEVVFRSVLVACLWAKTKAGLVEEIEKRLCLSTLLASPSPFGGQQGKSMFISKKKVCFTVLTDRWQTFTGIACVAYSTAE